MVIMAATLLTLLLLHSGTIRLAGAARFTGSLPMLTESVLADQMVDPSGSTRASGRFGPELGGLEWFFTVEDVTWDDPVNLSDQQLDRLKRSRSKSLLPKPGNPGP